jgi:hypothetical protein
MLSLLAYILARWHAIATGRTHLPDWGEVTQELALLIVPDVLLKQLLARLEQLKPYLDAYLCSPGRWCKL